MCGISGILSLTDEPVQPDEIAAQLGPLIHRGPDQGGVYVSPGRQCGLGIRRLSIIDVAGGQQPLKNETGSVQLVYNGETYNHQALRAELAHLGHRPGTHSDGEAIVHGYESWGAEGTLRRLRGMAAFALWDHAQRQLFLARDRFGIKPLYYAPVGGRLYFGSEIKAILACPAVPRRVNLPALAAMMQLGFVPGPATMFDGIFKLPPAHYLLARNGGWHIRRYWQLDFTHTAALSEAQAAAQFLALLEEAVRLRLMSEVPLGALLSGGLDSGTVAALVQAHTGQRLKTVSIGFDQAHYDESVQAQAMARHLGTEHHAVTFTAADFADYPQVMYHLEEPQAAATAMPIYRLYQACRQAGLTVVLTGEGADELLGGYHWHRGDALMPPLLALPGWLRRAAAALPLPMSAAARRVLARGHRHWAERYADWLELPAAGYRPGLLAAGMKHHPPAPLAAAWVDMPPHATPLHRRIWLEAQTRLADFITFEVDKMSMAHSIEARVPFLDHKLWEFCAALPPHFKLKGSTEKYLLRRAVRGIVPEPTRTRPKKGLAAPYAHWLRAARLPEWAETALSAAVIRQAGLFHPPAVQALRCAHQAGQPHLGPLLMGVLSTQVWHHLFIDS